MCCLEIIKADIGFMDAESVVEILLNGLAYAY